MKTILLHILLMLVPGLAVAPVASHAHEFHMSKGQIEYVAAEKALQITLHLFIDDLEEALRRGGASGLHLGTDREAARADEYLELYLKKHFSLSLNGQSISYTFIGKETSDDLSALWCYLLVEQADVPRQIKVRNDLLLDVFDDQKNILNVICPGGKRATLLFEKDNTVQQAGF